MKVLVYPHSLRIGGIQLVAIRLAAAARDLGHDVVVCAPGGELAGLVAERGLALRPLPEPSARPSWELIRHVTRVARQERVELIHAYARTACLEAYLGPHVRDGIPLVTTMMGAFVPRPFPRDPLLIVGTARLREAAAAAGHRRVALLEPPIDTGSDHPAVDGTPFRRAHGIDAHAPLLVLVSRLARAVKAEGIARTIAAAGSLADDLPVRLVVVGDGDAFAELERQGAAVNAAAGRSVVTLTGPLTDPRPAYAAADVVLGMGSSALRGMAFGKPCVILGVGGFSEVFGPATQPLFTADGMFGAGDGGTSPARLTAQLRGLLDDPALRHELGSYGRAFVCRRFGLEASGAALDRLYQQAFAHRTPWARRWIEALRVGGHVALSRARAAGRHRLLRPGGRGAPHDG